MTKMVNMFVCRGQHGGCFMVEADIRNLMARYNAPTIIDALNYGIDETDDQYIVDYKVYPVSEQEARSFGAM